MYTTDNESKNGKVCILLNLKISVLTKNYIIVSTYLNSYELDTFIIQHYFLARLYTKIKVELSCEPTCDWIKIEAASLLVGEIINIK